MKPGKHVPLSSTYLYYNANGETGVDRRLGLCPGRLCLSRYDGAGRKTVESVFRVAPNISQRGRAETGDNLYSTTFFH